MSKTSIPRKVESLLWARAAGRCEYRGCNKDLTEDLESGTQDAKFGFMAHIIADEPGGPRGHPQDSALLARDVTNLMLMCGKHHRLIDVEKPQEHSVALLHEMKRSHETRVRQVTEAGEDRASHVLCYDAVIGGHESPVSFERVRRDMLPERYAADGRAIQIGMMATGDCDADPDYWGARCRHLRKEFEWKVKERVVRGEIAHLSVFALAPQPLLIELGRLLGDIVPAEIRQPHRDPKGWRWADDRTPVVYTVGRPSRTDGPPALVLAISATITDERVTSVLGSEAAIWSIRTPNPNNDILRSKQDLAEFVRVLKALLDEMKAVHGEAEVISVFPALPASAAVEVGRSWMPKADLPLLIYDQQPGKGVSPTLRIRAEQPERLALGGQRAISSNLQPGDYHEER